MYCLFYCSCSDFTLPQSLEKETEPSWSGTEAEFESKFKSFEVNGTYVFYDLKENHPFTGKVNILNSDGAPWLSHQYTNGLEDGERIVWLNGKVYEKHLYSNGKYNKLLVKKGKKVN